MKFIVSTSMTTAALLILSLGLSAREQEGRPFDPDAQVDFRIYKCSDHIEILEAADGRAAVRIVWAHGYHSGLRGVNTESPPVTWMDIQNFANRLEESCRADPSKLCLLAIREIE